eukprot:ANDGO_01497.mRNA.1 Trafficking protein particle complex subunit 2
MYFVIVSPSDAPLYELDVTASLRGMPETVTQLHQFVVHAALDMVDEQQWTTSSMHLKQVDKFNEFAVSAYVTASGARFLVLYEASKNMDDAIKNFFVEIHESFLKILLNPFYGYLRNEPIRSGSFDNRVRTAARKHLMA